MSLDTANIREQCAEVNRPLVFEYMRIRNRSLDLVRFCSPEDMTPQSMPDASPLKWHLAHTTWFFETFIVKEYDKAYVSPNPEYVNLFNSYYNTVGVPHARPQRGLLTRPAISEVLAYRAEIDDIVCELLKQPDAKLDALITTGLHHEMQHQELMLTDALHLFAQNPLKPVFFPRASVSASLTDSATGKPNIHGLSFAGGLTYVGADLPAHTNWESFIYDCEAPKHPVFVAPFTLSKNLVTNRQWLEFMADGGYEKSQYWLSDGWAYCVNAQWQHPLYWQQQKEGHWQQFTLHGVQPLDLDAPVCHVSYFEADAYARWRGARLPTEWEWEHAASYADINGHFAEQDCFTPQPHSEQSLFGSVWQWTQSPFMAYPGFSPSQGALAEYNGKFMNQQYVLRGGSCATPHQQIRATYRNFFYPHQRWQFSGVRLVEET